MESKAAGVRGEFEQAIAGSSARLAALADACAAADAEARAATDALIGGWRRRVAMLRNRSVAGAATRMIEG